jgi:RND family efflux transporter MFP subunit
MTRVNAGKTAAAQAAETDGRLHMAHTTTSFHLRRAPLLRRASLIAAGLACLTLVACGSKPDAAAPGAAAQTPRAMPVRSASVERRDIVETLTVTGTLRPRAEVKIIAEVTARLDRVLKDEGSAVKKGELVAVLDETDYRLTLQRAEAALAVADANRAHAAAERDRANSLLKTGGITDKDHLAAQVNLQVAEASLGQSKVEVAIAQQNVTRTRIIAPFAGHIANKLADAGSVLPSGTAIFSLVDDAVLEFRGSVPSSDYAKVRVGAPVSLTVDGLPDETIAGEITRIAPMVQERNRSFELVARVPGQERLVGGMFARAAVKVREIKDALLVPPSAVLREGAEPGAGQIFVVTSGKAERRTIALGVERPDAIQVIKGLAAGDSVVIDPPVSLASGAPVQVQTTASTDKPVSPPPQ